MNIEELFERKLDALLSEVEFKVRKDEAGFIASKKYLLGEKIIFFEISKKSSTEFRVRISLWITNQPVQKIHSLVNERIASTPFLSYPISFLSKKLDKENENFERKKFDGLLGNAVSKESLSQYMVNFESCLKSLILPFLENFIDQSSFDKWLNEPVLDGKYNFETDPIWKDAINSLIVSRLVCSKDFNALYQIWLDQKLPKGDSFDTREELIQIQEILSSDQFP